MNLYEYVKNNPVRFIDPLGLDGFEYDNPFVSLGLNGPTDSDFMKDREIPPSNISLGAGGSFHVAGIGLAGYTSIAIDTNLDICIVTTDCASLGAGYYGHLGISGSIGSGELCEGESLQEGALLEAGGPIGGNVLSDDDGLQAGTALVGLGGGYAAGYMGCYKTTICLTK